MILLARGPFRVERIRVANLQMRTCIEGSLRHLSLNLLFLNRRFIKFYRCRCDRVRCVERTVSLKIQNLRTVFPRRVGLVRNQAKRAEPLATLSRKWFGLGADDLVFEISMDVISLQANRLTLQKRAARAPRARARVRAPGPNTVPKR